MCLLWKTHSKKLPSDVPVQYRGPKITAIFTNGALAPAESGDRCCRCTAKARRLCSIQVDSACITCIDRVDSIAFL